uniref:Cytochrome P450 n=1 Tax=Araucaria cunninghamii TaxID=56994 RepID=A0A0D6QXT1_ARACU
MLYLESCRISVFGRKKYGKVFTYWLGTTPRIVVLDPEMIKQILSNKFGHVEKAVPNIQLRRLTGDYSLTRVEGEEWARHRRILNPVFHLENLKSMVPVVASSTVKVLEKWGDAIARGVKEIEVYEEFRCLTADVIARTAFGTSFEQGKDVFIMLAEQTVLAGRAMGQFYIPGSRFLPTADNLRAKRLERAMQKSLRRLIMNRKENADMGKTECYGSDLLGLLIAAYNDELNARKNFVRVSLEHVVDECRTFFNAGHETTSTLLAWTIVLLGMHTNWQERAREEVLHLFKKETPNADALSRLKVVNMILYEALRLYPPVAVMVRTTYKKMQLEGLTLPAGTELVLPTIAVHHDADVWGKDVNDFNPGRFSQGISKACTHPAAFVGFSMGPRVCIGQNFALIEAKVVISMILQRFSFVTSPGYVHDPAWILTVRPRHGAQISFQELTS